MNNKNDDRTTTSLMVLVMTLNHCNARCDEGPEMKWSELLESPKLLV